MTSNFLIKELKKEGIEAKIETQIKDGKSVRGILIGSGSVRPFVREFAYANVADGDVSQMVDRIKEFCTKSQAFSLDVATWDYAKENIRLCLCKKNQTTACEKDFLDLSLRARVITTTATPGMISSYLVAPEILKVWGVTEEEMFKAAEENTRKHLKILDSNDMFITAERARLKNMGVSESEITIIEKKMKENPTVALTSDDFQYGAASAVFEDVIKEIANQYDSDLVMFPSNIVEVVLHPIPQNPTRDILEQFNNLPSKVNAINVPDGEILGDHAYFYSREKEKWFETVEDYINHLTEQYRNAELSDEEIMDIFGIDLEVIEKEQD